MLALLNPMGVVISAIFVAGVFVGADSMSRAAGDADLYRRHPSGDGAAGARLVLALRLTRARVIWR